MNWFKKLSIEKEEDQRRNNGDNEGDDPFIIKVNDRRTEEDSQFFDITEDHSERKKSTGFVEFGEGSTSKDSVILNFTKEIEESEITKVEISTLENSTKIIDLAADYAADALSECDNTIIDESILKSSEVKDVKAATLTEFKNEYEIRQIAELKTEENLNCENCYSPGSSPTTSSFLGERKFILVDSEEFFDDPEDVLKYRQEASFLEELSEWVIVECPDITVASDESFFTADNMKESEFHNSSSSCTFSSVSSTVNIEDDNDFYLYCDCAQYLDDHMAVIDSSWLKHLYKIFWKNNVRIGLAIVQPKEEINELRSDLEQKQIEGENSLDFLKTNKLTYFPININNSPVCGTNNNKLDKKPCENDMKRSAEISNYYIEKKKFAADAIARSLMGALKSYEMEISSTTDSCCSETNDSNNHEDEEVTLHKIKDHFDIKKYFKLDDDGNILLDINHIIEEKGYGFLMKRSKKLYRGIIRGKVIDENFIARDSLIDCIKTFFHNLREYLIGHPRNKLPLGSPGESIRIYTLLLANDNTSTFSRNIENFIACTKESREAAPQVVMRNMRQFMNGMKNYLVKHGEADFHQEVQKARSRLKSDEFLNLDAILESVMHQLVVLPLREHLYGMFVDFYTRSGDIHLLVENVKYACARGPIEFGIRASITPPVTSALHQISTLLVKLQEAELPLDKLDLFLCVISSIFDATGCPRGQQLGADDFLPILVYVVAKCGFVGAEIEAEFMWGLLQPALLSGEAGYYLTALCSAVHVLKSFMASENEGTGSLDWRSSTLPACSSVLRVIIPDECNGSLQTRTLPVRPHTTTKEVCRIIAHKARITNPQDYGLFKLVDGEETLLAETECPQDARIAARGKHCMLAYKRIDAKIAWPTVTQLTYT